jgi:hypothetical protein
MLSESKKNDKFLVMFTQVDPSVDSEADFNGAFESASADLLQQKKIPCTFPPSFGLLAATGMSASGTAISPIAPSLSSTMLAETGSASNVGRSPSIKSAGAVGAAAAAGASDALKTELLEANRKIERLTKELKVKHCKNKESAVFDFF